MEIASTLTHEAAQRASMTPEQAHEYVERLVAPMRGQLGDVIQSFGGVEGYMRWVRSEDTED